jgi:hypothetical protein
MVFMLRGKSKSQIDITHDDINFKNNVKAVVHIVLGDLNANQ